MHVNRKAFRSMATMIIIAMLGTMLQGLSAEKVEAAAPADLEVIFGAGTHIGNLTYEADNSFVNIYANTPGFTQTKTDADSEIDWGSGDIYTGKGDNETTVEFEIDIAKNPALKALAASGQAEVVVGWNSLKYYTGGFIFYWTRVSSATFTLGDEVILTGSSHGGELGPRSASRIIEDDSKLHISVYGEGKDGGDLTGARGLYIKFQDKTRPEMTSYIFTGNGAERHNDNINQRELYVKQDEKLTLDYQFTEPVKPTALNSAYYEHFLRHPLFANPNGTGLPAAGQTQYLENKTYTANNLNTYQDHIKYEYTGVKYHNSGNLPLEPLITGTSASGVPLNQTMEEKIRGAVLADTAGNVAITDFPNVASNASNEYLRGKVVNPFDYNNGGYRVIVDGVAPKYTKTGNGIQPEIVTGVTLNKNDTVDFTMQMTEEAVVKRDWDVDKTFILFNTGMKAYYVSGSNSKKWTFRAHITEELLMETPLLKAIAVSNDVKGDDSDINVIQDYAGNLLIQPANYDGIHIDGDESLVNSKIDWARLAIDNKPPIIDYHYEVGGATNQTYQKNGKITIDANDPSVLIPELDPVVEERGLERPSRGIYRPSNNTGAGSPSVGLVYYVWTQSPNDPFAAEAADQYAAIKRYSLSAKQPSEELYPGKYTDLSLQVVNNKTNMIAPPPEALTSENSGDWYLHTWTADMTWDTARELMQYEKKKKYVLDNASEYEAWKQELTSGSDADRTFYADNKALAAVGDYGNVASWKLGDFNNDDSNWTYNSTLIKLDNRKPTVLVNEVNGDNTFNVQLSATISDAHSGVKKTSYQWVLEGKQPKEINWKTAALTGDKLSVSSLNEVEEDGVYHLYIKVLDQAGNELVASTETPVTINSKEKVLSEFSPPADTNYVKSHDVIFNISGVTPDAVGYVISANATRPVNNADFTALNVSGGGSITAGFDYLVPVNADVNGHRYIHMMAKAGDRYYYFSKAYYFDNQAPTIGFSKNGVTYPLESHKVTVSVGEPYSVYGLVKQYQWVKQGKAAPDADSPDWQELPEDGAIVLDSKELEDGEIADYRLYVYAIDGAGNSTIKSTAGTFKVSKNGGAEIPPAPSHSDLIYLYGDDTDGYTAILKLTLDTEDKKGYEYSISADNGSSWNKWRTFTSFVSVKADSDNASALPIQVKYRTPGGAISDPQKINIETLSTIEPVYALTTLSTTRPISPLTGVDVEVSVPLGIKVIPTDVNPSIPERTGNTFKVKENGFYTFELTDINDGQRKDTLYVVINNVDGTPPEGSIEYLITAQTNSNVTVRLDTSEPVQVTNNEGRGAYTFTANGSFTFEFKDEAGNTGTATAIVQNIDKESPKVRLVRSYAYGKDGEKTFGTVQDANGNVLFSSGVTLVVQAEAGETKEFKIVKGKETVTLQSNGIQTFVVSDLFGNTKVLTEDIDNIIAAPPQVESITYTYVDQDGQALPQNKIVTIDGKSYANGNMLVTLSGHTTAPNKVFSGVVPIAQNGSYTNQISGDEGNFTYSRTYTANGSTTIAVSDLLGNVNKVTVTVDGIDNKAPELVLKRASAAVVQNKKDFNFAVDLGGFTVSDNVSKPENIKVSISKLDLTKTGRQQITYTAVDQVGNTVSVVQDVYVVKDGGILIFANDMLISSSAGETALFDRSTLTFSISGYNLMNVGGKDQVNELGTYDLLYQPGLYREGQMKYIASKITYKELISGQFKVTFPGAGWYTIIVRNQEREREYATFFISKAQ
ncbi:hypothetical protein BK133_10065 [Paenibacillus sp. FSL H8-0548]|uniref:hypothetical protein n=1 Tax=Paenibacillus sp. FSL H8-0548 TaxID=1920422 RepID=UPI00096C8322|nr:hypothetical protein [Paenibacillus sp. FSL H8-0548]OMF35795.1 hypothetical protein BK133_10065 [Paenibacillus sp. FSL H8-0548]